MRQVILHVGEDGQWIAEVPSLPGCISQGKTLEDAIANVREAIDLWVEVMHDRGEAIPPERFEARVCVV